MPELDYFPIGTSARLTLSGLKDENDAYLDGSATVVGTIVDTKGVVVTGGESVPFTYVNPSSGNFQAMLDPDVAFAAGKTFWLLAVVEYGGKQMTIRLSRIAKYLDA